MLQALLRRESPQPLSEAMPKEWTRLLYLTALLAPLKPYQLPGKKKPEPLVEHVLRVSLKGTVKDTADAQLILDSAQVCACACVCVRARVSACWPWHPRPAPECSDACMPTDASASVGMC